MVADRQVKSRISQSEAWIVRRKWSGEEVEFKSAEEAFAYEATNPEHLYVVHRLPGIIETYDGGIRFVGA